MPNVNTGNGRNAAATTLVRLPLDLRERLRTAAQNDRRSMNSQIIVLLERALPVANEKTETAATVPARGTAA